MELQNLSSIVWSLIPPLSVFIAIVYFIHSLFHAVKQADKTKNYLKKRLFDKAVFDSTEFYDLPPDNPIIGDTYIKDKVKFIWDGHKWTEM